MRRVLLPHLIGHLLSELHHRYVMYIEAAAAASLRAQHQQHNMMRGTRVGTWKWVEIGDEFCIGKTGELIEMETG
jgi:hypothetical protein